MTARVQASPEALRIAADLVHRRVKTLAVPPSASIGDRSAETTTLRLTLADEQEVFFFVERRPVYARDEVFIIGIALESAVRDLGSAAAEGWDSKALSRWPVVGQRITSVSILTAEERIYAGEAHRFPSRFSIDDGVLIGLENRLELRVSAAQMPLWLDVVLSQSEKHATLRRQP